MASASKIVSSLLEGLRPREREVIAGRFGLGKSGKPQTLAEIGRQHKVTRERVRQVEAAALRALRKEIFEKPLCVEVLERGKKHLKDSGGVLKKEHMIAHHRPSAADLDERHLALLIEASEAFYSYPEDDDFWHFYYLDKNSFRTASAFASQWIAFLRAKKAHVLRDGYRTHFNGFVKRKGIPEPHAEAYVGIVKHIRENPYGEIGLWEWPEIYPRTIRDRVYFVLKRGKKPLHFVAIAKFINDSGLAGREASAPTVHNELIKDSRFVLVGRGIYALREHGYEPGTAREVIERILMREGALRPDGVIAAIGKERFLKPNTILVNLQNKRFFERLPDGTYRPRASRS